MVNISKTRIYQIFSVLDSAIALFLVFPLACLYWRGAWELIGYYVLKDRTPLNYWVHFGIGNLQMVGMLLLPILDEKLDRSKKIKFWLITRIFMYLHTLTYMFYWHGLWELLNHYFGTDLNYNLVTVGVAWLALCLLGSCRSTMWPPFFIALDDQPGMLRANCRFKAKVDQGRNWKDYITDCYFSQIIILGLAILCWRSMFNIYDRALFPKDKLKSDACSAIIGAAGSVLILSLQIPLGAISEKLSRERRHFLKIVYEDVAYAVIFVILAFLWRGVWNLSNTYFLPQRPLGSWVNIAMGSVGMIAMHVFSEVCAFGIEDDGLDPGGEAFFPVKYLRIHFSGHCESPSQNQVPQENKEKELNVFDNNAFTDEEKVAAHSSPYSAIYLTNSPPQKESSRTVAPPAYHYEDPSTSGSTRQRVNHMEPDLQTARF